MVLFQRWSGRAGLIVLMLSAATSSHAAVTISSDPTQNMSCSAGVCTPTAKDAVLNSDDLAAMLASSSVQVNTGTGNLATKVQDIIIITGFSWSTGNTLALDAYRSVDVNDSVKVAGTSGGV